MKKFHNVQPGLESIVLRSPFFFILCLAIGDAVEKISSITSIGII